MKRQPIFGSKTAIAAALGILMSGSYLAPACRADNPVVQTKFTADPAPMVYKNTVYLFTGHDEDDARGFKMRDWLCYTSTDMANWTDRGPVANLHNFAWAAPTSTGWGGFDNGAWAAQCIERNGKFYMYCPIQGRGIGVLVADNPLGPYTDPIGKPLIGAQYDSIDPTVFIDDDGQAYLYWGNPGLHYATLNKDMVSFSGDIVKEPVQPKNYQEGPWFYKRSGHYYMAYASTCCPEGIGYSMSDGPIGPWTSTGMVMNPSPASSGNHPGIIDYKGHSYVFGFNYYQNYLQTSEHRERRSVCVDEFTYNPDGTIPTLPWWTTSGPTQIGTLNPYGRTEAETIAYETGVRTEPIPTGGLEVYSIGNGSYIKVKGVNFGSGAKSFDARVASATTGGNIELRLDSPVGQLVGTCAVQNTGGWDKWTTQTCKVSGAAGTHDLYLHFTGESADLFHFDWWQFHK